MSYQYPPQQGYAPAAAPAQPVDRTLQGVLAQVEVRQNGWHRFHVMEPGNQYPTKLDTKKAETIQQAMALMGQPIAAQIREQESNTINPHSGKPYINRYLNDLAPAGFAPGVQPAPGAVGPQGQVYTPPSPQAQPQTYGQQPPQPQVLHHAPVVIQQQPQGQDERSMQIMRQAAAKVVAASWQLLPEEQQTAIGLVEACEVWMAYFVHGPLRFGVTPFGGNSPTDNPGGGSEYHQGYAAVPGMVQNTATGMQNGPGPQQGGDFFADPGPQSGDPGPEWAQQ